MTHGILFDSESSSILVQSGNTSTVTLEMQFLCIWIIVAASIVRHFIHGEDIFTIAVINIFRYVICT